MHKYIVQQIFLQRRHPSRFSCAETCVAACCLPHFLYAVILENSGDVLKFAGDALLAVWPCDRVESDGQLMRVVEVCVAIQSWADRDRQLNPTYVTGTPQVAHLCLPSSQIPRGHTFITILHMFVYTDSNYCCFPHSVV